MKQGKDSPRFDRRFMLRAVELAKRAGAEGEIPVGAVIVKNGEIISEGMNHRKKTRSVLSHAELDALDAACKRLGDWRLDGCTLYVTLEPCPMCAGAIINSRVSAVVFGAYDSRAGSLDSVVQLATYPFESRPEIFGGVCEEECAGLLSDFFKAVRKKSEEKNN